MKYLLIILLFLIGAMTCQAQTASRINPNQTTLVGQRPVNILYVDTTTGNQLRIYAARLDSLKRQLVRLDSSYVITRTFNSNFTISTTRAAWVVYSFSTTQIDPAFVHLEVSSNGGGTWTEICRGGSDWTNPGSIGYLNVNGIIPIGNLVRLRTSGTGAGNLVYLVGQETQY